jgi:phosphohistidine swiveling domain-containing protein
MSHLAINGLDHGILVVRDPDAMETYENGMTVTIDGARGTIRVHPGFDPADEPADAPRP